MLSEKDEGLKQFFGGYFHQDWNEGGASSWEDVLDVFLAENTQEYVATVCNRLRSWLSEGKADMADVFGCDFDPRSIGLDDRAWVERILDYLNRKQE